MQKKEICNNWLFDMANLGRLGSRIRGNVCFILGLEPVNSRCNVKIYMELKTIDSTVF